ncbi:aerotaxis receptor [Paucibacter oligotrophus]|uniref:Aerotaxis receptor n=1 Tax=Roseateles oligotrophus TaxID=1769250 RepID=A0A840LBZ6_9BURK|nr:methyl-accepting chemotaxis protein [Roseateles oligotrophus]MBB4845680.1 aerotaxis receptor [Roseateles oligotrophus]
MRNNLPVSQREYPFPKGKTLVSTTDLQGRIQHCNAAFAEVSGFDRAELHGQHHNLIRHPDMPQEAFRDLWATIQQGRPWSGMVKNRRKDGDHYWVMANVTPLLENGRPVAFMSVRTEASRAQIEAAEQLYARMRGERRKGALVHVLRRGQVLRQDLQGRLAQLARIGPRLGRWLPHALMTAAAMLAGAWQGPLALELLLLLGLSMLTAALAHRQTRKAIQPVLDFAHRVAAGDLSASLPRSGHDLTEELETALNQLSVNIRAIVSDTRSELAGMSRTMQAIAQGNQDMARRTEAQAASLEQTAAAMEQITGTVRSSTDTATQASGVAAELRETSSHSAEVVHHATHSMGAISGSSKRIGEIIKVIDSIAFQTNILALNAAVESARAGDHGRGFAVVANEVRALAQRSSEAAREIARLISDSADKVSEGERQTSSARQSIDKTLQSVQQFNGLIGQIHLSAREQLLGITQVNQAISQMEAITLQNAGMVQELAHSAQALLGQVDEVNASVRVFRLSPAGH